MRGSKELREAAKNVIFLEDKTLSGGGEEATSYIGTLILFCRSSKKNILRNKFLIGKPSQKSKGWGAEPLLRKCKIFCGKKKCMTFFWSFKKNYFYKRKKSYIFTNLS